MLVILLLPDAPCPHDKHIHKHGSGPSILGSMNELESIACAARSYTQGIPTTLTKGTPEEEVLISFLGRRMA